MPHPFAGHAFTLPQGSSPSYILIQLALLWNSLDAENINVHHFEKGSIEDQKIFKETIAPAESGIVG